MNGILKPAFLMFVFMFFLSGCQGHQAGYHSSVEDACEKYSASGDCIGHPEWPEAPVETLILTMPRGYRMHEPPVPFSHQVHAEMGCTRCHGLLRGKLVEKIDFSRV